MRLLELEDLLTERSVLRNKVVAKKLQLSAIERPDYLCMNTESIQLPETTKSEDDILLSDLTSALTKIDSSLKDKGLTKELRDNTLLSISEDYDNHVFIDYNYYVTEPEYKQDKINKVKAELSALQEQLNEVESKMKELGLEF